MKNCSNISTETNLVKKLTVIVLRLKSYMYSKVIICKY